MEVTTMACAFRPSVHAKGRMIERGISRYEATKAIVKGTKRQNGMRIFAQLRGIEVVFVQRPCNYFVITLYRR